MSKNQNKQHTTFKGDKGIACPLLPPYQTVNPVTRKPQLNFIDCLGDGCNLYQDGDCTLKGIFHKNYKTIEVN